MKRQATNGPLENICWLKKQKLNNLVIFQMRKSLNSMQRLHHVLTIPRENICYNQLSHLVGSTANYPFLDSSDDQWREAIASYQYGCQGQNCQQANGAIIKSPEI